MVIKWSQELYSRIGNPLLNGSLNLKKVAADEMSSQKDILLSGTIIALMINGW